ncbi:MAG: hypothetical protein ABIJ56_13855 [Pseudomonadota bacterium]
MTTASILFLSMLMRLAASGGEEASEEEPGQDAEEDGEVIILVDEEDGAEDAGKTDEPGDEPACPACTAARFYFILEEVTGVDVRHETSAEDIIESLIRLDSGFAWKNPGGKFGAKAEARFDFLITGREGEEGDYERSRSEVRFDLREWYGEIITKPVDITIGSQVLKFSKCDVLAPGDFLAPFDMREPYRGEWSMERLPVLAVRTDWKLSTDLFITFALVPFFTSSRFDLYGTDQAILGPNSPELVTRLIGELEKVVHPSIEDRVRDALVATEVPEEWGLNQSIALRIEKLTDVLEAGLTYLLTFGPMPELEVNPDFMAALVRFQAGDPAEAGRMISDIISRGDDFLSTKYRRMHVFAVDAAFEAGPLVIATEVGWIPSMILNGIDLTALPVPVVNVETGLMTSSIQVQYNYGEVFFLAAEAAYARMLDPVAVSGGKPADGGPPPTFMFGDETHQLVIALASRLTLLKGKLEWSVMGQAGVFDRSMILSTRLSYEIAGRVRPFIGAVVYEVFGDRPDPDLSLTASRDFNDEIFFGLRFVL